MRRFIDFIVVVLVTFYTAVIYNTPLYNFFEKRITHRIL